MRKASSIEETVKKGRELMKEKETEKTWSKMDEVLERVSEIGTKEEAYKVQEILPLICIGIESNRSKLSGSGCKALSRLFEILGNDLKDSLPHILPHLLSALGKTNKVIFMRALGTAEVIGSTCTLKSISKHIRSNIASKNKTVRQGLLELAVKGIEKERTKELVEVIESLAEDAHPEIRARAKEGLAKIAEVDRKTIITLSSTSVEIKKENTEESKEKSKEKRVEQIITPSVIESVNAAPKPNALKIKESGANVIVRGISTSFIYNTPIKNIISTPLKPGHSLERIGQRLELHKKEIEEGLKKEWTPKKTPIGKKRQREGSDTPVSISKNIKYTEQKSEKKTEEGELHLSEEICNLSITRTEETEHIVENKEMYDNIFSSREAQEVNEFAESCEAVIEEPMSETDYSVLAPDVLIRRTTTRKI